MTQDAPRVRYETPAPRVARVVLARPETRNAQDTRMLYELNDAFDQAAQDDEISVVVLAGDGPHFSSGHDLREGHLFSVFGQYDVVGTWCGFTCDGAEKVVARERELFLGLSERWRNFAKPTIAEVQGMVVSGGLMLVWPCDLIVAADDAVFIDNTVDMGVSGAEFFNHPWELGARKAKEMLFTSEPVDAQTALSLGMVNKVVPRAALSDTTLDLAVKIAQKPLFALKLVKEAVNAAQDASGRTSAMNLAFHLHQLSHSHNFQIHGTGIDPTFLERTFPAASRRAQTT